MKTIIFIITLIFSTVIFGQYPPAAGQSGTTAISKDSSIIINWANTVTDFSRGYLDIANPALGFTSFGDSSFTLGQAEGTSTDVVSLGDAGSITLTFPNPIKNGNGPDFVVFENSFSDDFLELAHVEVSTDGVNFVRIPSISLTQTATQTDGFGSTDPTKIHNLAGKYRQGFGTPFDLQDIIDSTNINLDSINFVKIIDVIGTINTTYSTYDSQGNIINDPYSTAFESGGFDLDAVGVINENKFVGLSSNVELSFVIYPNPAQNSIFIHADLSNYIEIFSLNGELVYSSIIKNGDSIDVSLFKNGIYILKNTSNFGVQVKKLVIKH